MKNRLISYAVFIIAFSTFIWLRLYAGKLVSASSVNVASISKADSVAENVSAVDVSVAASGNDDAASQQSETDEQGGLLNDEWHGDFTPVEEFTGDLPRLICWGDSLTQSIDNKSAYPDVLRAISGCEVMNYGVASESTNMIAMREGGIPVLIKATVIPATTDLIPVFLRSEGNGTVFFLDYGDGGVNPCSIGGITGTLSQLNGSYYFARSEKGERTTIEADTPLETFAMSDQQPGDVLILFTGTNDMPDSESVYNIIKTQRAMLEAAGCEKYIVIGLTYRGGMDEIEEVNDILANEYEDHFIDIRSYMLNYGLADAQITPTSQDEADIAKGEIPSSLRADYVHGNKYFYDLLARQVYRRLQYLGYVPLSID